MMMVAPPPVAASRATWSGGHGYALIERKIAPDTNAELAHEGLLVLNGRLKY